MELELKHLAAYLPYGLKCFYLHKTLEGVEVINKVFELGAIDLRDKKYMYWTHDKIFLKNTSFCGKGFSKLDFKPILRPLSDLTKEIEVNGEKFVPMEWLSKFIGAVEPCDQIKQTFWITRSGNNNEGGILSFGALCKHIDQFELFQKLLEWHFDIYGLIDNGLAIDINTL